MPTVSAPALCAITACLVVLAGASPSEARSGAARARLTTSAGQTAKAAQIGVCTKRQRRSGGGCDLLGPLPRSLCRNRLPLDAGTPLLVELPRPAQELRANLGVIRGDSATLLGLPATPAGDDRLTWTVTLPERFPRVTKHLVVFVTERNGTQRTYGARVRASVTGATPERRARRHAQAVGAAR